jgi:RNA polymerase sigma-70 factor (ECF subfamily)
MRDALIRFAIRRGVQSFDVEDVVQTAVNKATTKIHQFGNMASLSTWVHTILINVINNHARARQRVKRNAVTVPIEDTRETLVSSRLMRPDVQYDSSLLGSQVVDALSRLPFEQRVVFGLIAEGNSVKQVAAKLKIEEGTVKSRLSRARKQLRSDLADYAKNTGSTAMPGARLAKDAATPKISDPNAVKVQDMLIKITGLDEERIQKTIAGINKNELTNLAERVAQLSGRRRFIKQLREGPVKLSRETKLNLQILIFDGILVESLVNSDDEGTVLKGIADLGELGTRQALDLIMTIYQQTRIEHFKIRSWSPIGVSSCNISGRFRHKKILPPAKMSPLKSGLPLMNCFREI